MKGYRITIPEDFIGQPAQMSKLRQPEPRCKTGVSIAPADLAAKPKERREFYQTGKFTTFSAFD